MTNQQDGVDAFPAWLTKQKCHSHHCQQFDVWIWSWLHFYPWTITTDKHQCISLSFLWKWIWMTRIENAHKFSYLFCCHRELMQLKVENSGGNLMNGKLLCINGAGDANINTGIRCHLSLLPEEKLILTWKHCNMHQNHSFISISMFWDCVLCSFKFIWMQTSLPASAS